ncbi:hypothetical protein [Pseudoclavibacter soli]|uniref:hypothetical protein n=1 Tax=Pseudoclavibacter soli TaxID=452623 RepID=UPI00040AA60E|nr:hypothetical protein [Pseudoclavibacter soli]
MSTQREHGSTRLMRAFVFALFAAGLSGIAHAAVDGQIVSIWAVLVAAAVCTPIGFLPRGIHRRLSSFFVVLGAQGVMHMVFMSSAGGHAAHLATTSSSALAGGIAMVAAHTLAAVVAWLWLGFGAQLLSRVISAGAAQVHRLLSTTDLHPALVSGDTHLCLTEAPRTARRPSLVQGWSLRAPPSH